MNGLFWIFDTRRDCRVSGVAGSKLQALQWMDELRNKLAEHGDYTNGLVLQQGERIPYPECDVITGQYE